MARFAFGKIAVVEIEISNQSAVKKCRTIRRGFAATDQGALRTAAEIIDLLADQSDKFVTERPHPASQSVQHTYLQFVCGKSGHIAERRVYRSEEHTSELQSH